MVYTASLNGSPPPPDLAVRLSSPPDRGRAVLLDAGDLLGAGDAGRSRQSLEACAAAGYAALAVGDQELAAGLEPLSGYRDRYGMIAQNLDLCTAHGCLIFSGEPLVLERAGETIGVFALLDVKLGAEGARLVPAEIIARSLVGQLAAREVDWIIVLFHGTLREAERLAREAPGIHAIIVGHEQGMVRARRVGRTVIVSPGAGGTQAGVLSLSRDARGRVRHSNRFISLRPGVGGRVWR